MIVALICRNLFAQSDELFAAVTTKYSVKVEVTRQPFEWRGDGYIVRGRPADLTDIKKYAAIFQKEWGLLPRSVVEKAKITKLVFCAGLSLNRQERGAVPAFEANTMYFDPTLGAYNPHYQRNVIHHEFFHVIDQRTRRLFDDKEWQALNSKEFRYGAGGDKMRSRGVGELTDKLPGFLTIYATSACEEDKAELFSHMIVDGAFVRERLEKDPVMKTKFECLKRRLVEFDSNFDKAFWDSIPDGI